MYSSVYFECLHLTLQESVDLGEIMFSLCYLPTAGRLTLTVIKCRNLKAMDITGYSGMLLSFICLCLYFLAPVCSIFLFIHLDSHIYQCQQAHHKSFSQTYLDPQRQGERYIEKFMSHLSALLADPYVKVSLICDGRRLKKKKTSIKKNTLNPNYNEAIIFDIPPENMDQVSLHISVMDYDLWVWYFHSTNIMLCMLFTVYSLFSWCIEWGTMRSSESVV